LRSHCHFLAGHTGYNGGEKILGRIVVRDRIELAAKVLPKYFNHKSFAHFRRQLNYFYFARLGKGRQRESTYLNESVVDLNDILQLKRRPVNSSSSLSAEELINKHGGHFFGGKGADGRLFGADVAPQQKQQLVVNSTAIASVYILGNRRTRVDDFGSTEAVASVCSQSALITTANNPKRKAKSSAGKNKRRRILPSGKPAKATKDSGSSGRSSNTKNLYCGGSHRITTEDDQGRHSLGSFVRTTGGNSGTNTRCEFPISLPKRVSLDLATATTSTKKQPFPTAATSSSSFGALQDEDVLAGCNALLGLKSASVVVCM